MFQIDRKKLRYFDYTLFLSAIAISILGIITIYSTANGAIFAKRQVVWVILGIVGMLIVANIDPRHIKRNAWIFYLVVLVLLIFVFARGMLSHGAKRWIAISFIHIQPSEFVKIAVVFLLAAYFDENPKTEPYTMKELLYPMVVVLLPVVLIIKQPDLGTAIAVLVIALSMILISGVKKSLVVKATIAALVFMPFMWSKLKPYQKDRIMGFLDPYSAPTTYGYNTIQSEIAIGSGGLWGKGLHHATQTQLSFLPESHTDFIFSVFSEQWGFVGCFFVIGLYLVLLYRAFVIAKSAENDFDRLVCVGIITYLWISIVFNMGMTLGLLPVVGIPLVFFSYGGSSTITAFFAVGVLLSVGLRSKT
ncbi:rod shape-determining protein RodA [Hippea maritima]|uniref:Peptidoglycan glycosyltransferase RodA n=1 Tax=Hippea maritima (strain ATCC 700847 / DSM 10411 / MH2) TaxID=760142 RepID=F2LTJ8_HIPMA|nr:rod shape-determining protein RodA [Hippea maritima]AEA33323.1 rod shape-determining protein RodA [Hippea maritima DSM 10411]